MTSIEHGADGLRQRNVSIIGMSEQDARQAVLQLNALEESSAKDEKDKKTFGRTPDGTGMHKSPPSTGLRISSQSLKVCGH